MAKFLGSKVDQDQVMTALHVQFGPMPGWEQVTAKDLGLSGGSKTFFANSVYADAGLEIYRDQQNPKNFILNFSALEFDGVPAVFGHYLGNPPKFDTKYADDYAKIYAAVGKLAKGGDVLVTGFSLGGLAVNQMADRANTEFSKSDLTFVALGGEYISSSSAKLVNLGAYNDWFFGAYNAYARLYEKNDPGLKTIKNFAETVFAEDRHLDKLPAGSFLREFFSFDRTETHLPNSVNWAFHFEDGGKKSFIVDNYDWGHASFAMYDAVMAIGAAPFSSELSLKTATLFDFDTEEGGVLNVGGYLSEFAVTPKTLYTIGSIAARDVINGGKYHDRIAGLGGNDTLKGAAGNDKLYGGAGSDKLYGGAGKDTLVGDSGNDVLKGDAGNDVLLGGAGADRLYGGAGADTFVFRSLSHSTTAASRRDTIYDFKPSEKDRIDLSVIDANTKVSGNQEFKFIKTADFHKKAGELRYEKTGGDTLIQGDANGDGKADFAILIDASVTLRLGDFIL
ncbi:hypothetical protein GB928_016990 [Shinella curvata]|uniref:Hemolysin type calcium-binding protein n=1 Tax=Shinella curvata TaxID=1817964 RepID=A0ABT8XGM9_9HYPH|nr:M10 family metallopeptidase C-terminal domain-containing protein [Shinella curvata]MCJ8053561.1 hypothetical protein [Shinella curvata]MDO6122893.1 hypothetical protein [Shinella curvata]